MEATITSKGQITLPKALRDKHDLKTGQKVIFVEGPHGEILMRVRRNNPRALVGLLKPKDGKSYTIEELAEGAERGAVDSYLKSLK